MEKLPVPHDFDNQGLGAFVLRSLIDEMFQRSDAEIFRILNLYRGEKDGEDTLRSVY